jgi:PPP family 3-phenylpropionic acid transporter
MLQRNARPAQPVACKAKTEQMDESTSRRENRVLFLMQLLYITFYASQGCLAPYLPIYYHSLGHGGKIIGFIGSITPFTTFLVAPLWGLLSDWSDRPFLVLYATSFIALVGQLLLALQNNPTYITTMVFLTAIFSAPVKPLIDSLVMDQLKDRKQFGKLRLWGLLGFGVATSIAGKLLEDTMNPTPQQSMNIAPVVDVDSTMLQQALNHWQNMTGYRLLFFLHAILHIPTFICIRAFQTTHQESTKNKLVKHNKTLPQAPSTRIQDVLSMLVRDSDAILFFSLVFVMGISAAVAENFAYVRIREVGGGGKEMGLSRLISSLAGAPMFWFSGTLTELVGVDKVILLSLVTYGTRLGIYAFMTHPHHVFVAEALRGFAFGAFWSSSTFYACSIAAPGVRATMVR